MGKKIRRIYTRPYKTIIIKVHPDFVPRLKTVRVGIFARGITSGLSITGYLAFLFEINEYLPKEHKLTDYQIAKCCHSEFPKRKRMFDILDGESGIIRKRKGKHCHSSVASYRQKYNKGKLITSNKGVRFGPISFKYNKDGDRISFFRNSLLSENEFNQIMERYGPENRDTKHFDWEIQKKRQSKPKPTKNRYDSFDWCI